MLSQFSREGERQTLADLNFKFPKDVYPVGRLDADSEGLLLLTNDASLNQQMLHPKRVHHKTYLVQVEGEIDEKACEKLERGVIISLNGKEYKTLPAKVQRIINLPELPERNPPIRFRKNVPTSWIFITIHEGKNRQVRKMTAATGYPTLRLIRYSLCGIYITGKKPGEVMEIKISDIKLT